MAQTPPLIDTIHLSHQLNVKAFRISVLDLDPRQCLSQI